MKEMGQTGQIMERALAQTEKKMKQIAQGVLKDKLSGTMVREALAAPGKMLRPQMLILSACLIDETAAAAHMEHLVRWGAILELCHTASLLHDDVIDQSPIRRGRPTLMKRYGNSSAIYAGDYVLACVLREVLKSHGEDRALLLTDGIEEMCVGEMNQTRCRYRQNVTIEQYNKNIAGKTGVLFAAACRLGAMEVTEDPKIAEEYEQLGRKLGRAFQLRDDLLDITSDAKAAGKLVMQDFREGIYTLPVLLARDHTTFGPVVRTLMKKSRKGILREEDLEALKEALLKSRAIDRVSQEIRGLLEECRHAAGHSSCLWAKKRTEAILDRLKTMEGCRASDIQGAVVKK